MAAAAQLAPLIGQMGQAAKDNNIFEWVSQPMLPKRKANQLYKKNPDLWKVYPLGEIPDPKYPAGVKRSIPWWAVFALVFLGVPIAVAIAYLVKLESEGKLGEWKEKLGLKDEDESQWPLIGGDMPKLW